MSEDIFKRVPPQNIEAEMAVLGAILLDNSAIHPAAEILTAEDFYRESHREIFRAALALAETKRPVDAITLCDALRPQLEAVGGAGYIAELAACTPTALFVLDHARIVKEKSVQRQLASTMTEIASRAYDAPAPWSPEWTDDLVGGAQYEVERIANQATRKPEQQKSEAIDVMLWRVENQAAPGIRTGFHTLDRWFLGFKPGEVTVLAARTSRGKTSLAVQMAINAALENFKTIYFTCEMTVEQLWQRAVSCEAQLSLLDVQMRPRAEGQSPYRGDEKERADEAAARLKAAPLEILYRPGLRPRQLRADCARLCREMGGLDFVVIDYLGMMRPDHQERDRWRQMQEVVLAVNGLAGDLGLPILLLSQLNREAADETKPPSLAQLRDTGTAEENSANILFLCQEPKQSKDGNNNNGGPPADPSQPEQIKIVIGKQRNGWAGGHIPLLFYKKWTRFELT